MEDKVFRLRGLVYAAAEADEVASARELLLKEQRPEGSWSQLPDLKGDAYATGSALVALRVAGLPADDAAYRKGVKYLLGTQKEDGAWIVETRSRPIQIFFDNGDPGGKSQFISFVATNWAVLALLETLPPVAASKAK
jgi:N-acyl-D-amino-acid deacylase